MNKKTNITLFIFHLLLLSLLASTASGKGRDTASSNIAIPSIELPNLDFLFKEKDSAKKASIQHINLMNAQLRDGLDEIAKLAAEIQSDSDAYSDHPKVHFVHSSTVNTKDESKYIHDISVKLQQAGEKSLSTKLLSKSAKERIIVAFTLDKKGHLLNSTLSKPSNIKKLDEAILSVIKKASPYQPFSKNMKSQYDQINIVRTFLFSANTP